MDENNISQSATLQQEPRGSFIKKLTPKWIIISCSILLAVILVVVVFFIIKGNKQNEKLRSSEFCVAECFAHVPS